MSSNTRVSWGPVDEALIRISRLGAFAGLLAPLFFLPGVWFTFTSGKAWLFQLCLGLTFPFWVLLTLRQPAFRPSKSKWLLATGLILLAMALSVIFGADKHVAFFGSTDKMDGLLTELHLYAWLLMAVTVWKDVDSWQRATRILMGVALLSAVLAFLQIPVPSILGPAADARISGTTGNPVFLSSLHLQFIFFASLVFVSDERHRWLAVVVGVTSLGVMLLTGSRGGLVGLFVGLLVFGIAFSLSSRKKWLGLGVGATLLLLGASWVLVLTVARPHPALASFWKQHSNVAHLFEMSDVGRRLPDIQTTLQAVREKPLFGWGLGNYATVYDTHFDPHEGCRDRALDDAHNLFLQLLTTQGALGLLAWMFFFSVVVSLLVRQIRQRHLSATEGAIMISWAVAAWVPTLFNPDSLSTKFTFVYLCALTFAQAEPALKSLPFHRGQARWRLGLTALPAIILVIFTSIFPAMASRHAVLAMQRLSEGKLASPWPHLLAASKLPTPYLEEQLIAGSQVIIRMSEAGVLKKFPLWEHLLQVQDTWTSEYQTQHKRVRFLVMLANTLFWQAQATQDAVTYSRAETLFRELLNRQPRRQEVLYAYADVLARQKKLDEAEGLLRQAVATDTAVGQAHFRLGVFLWQHRQNAGLGAESMKQGVYASCRYLGQDSRETTQLAQALWHERDIEGLKEMAVLVGESPATAASDKDRLQVAEFLNEAGLERESQALLKTMTMPHRK